MNPTILVTKNKNDSNKFLTLKLLCKCNKINATFTENLTDYLKLLLIRLNREESMNVNCLKCSVFI